MTLARIPGLFPMVRLWKVFILTWARNHLTKHAPTHPDLPKVVLSLAWWKEANRG